MIDMHAHWRPAEVADALRVRTREPRILHNRDGVEVLKSHGWARSRSPRPSMTSISISVGWTARGRGERAVTPRFVLLGRGPRARGKAKWPRKSAMRTTTLAMSEKTE